MIVAENTQRATGFGLSWHVFGLIARYKLLVAVPILIGIVAGYLIFKTTPRRFLATSVVALDVRKITVAPMDMVVSRLPQENPALKTEIDILGSRSVAERVIDRLGISALAPLLTPQPGPITRLWHFIVRASPASPDARSEEQTRQELVDRLTDGLQISNDGHSYTIYISFTAGDPVFAAMVANSYAEEYFVHQTMVKLNAIHTASEWLGKKVEELRQKVEKSEQAVDLFKQKAGLLGTAGTNLGSHRMEVLNAELVRVRASAAEARARLETATGLSRQTDGLAAFSEALNSPIILKLREQQEMLKRERQSLEDAGATKSGRLPAIESELRSLDTQIRQEMDRVLGSLNREVAIAELRQKAVEQAIQDEITASGAADSASIQLNELQREAAANRSLYESFLNRFKSTVEQDDLAGPEAQLISKAQPPGGPSTPKLAPLLALGIFLGASIGIGGAFLWELLDDRVRSAGKLEERFKLPVLGALPSPRTPATEQARNPAAPYDDHYLALQQLQAVFRLFPATRDARVIAVTSALLGEGKTFVSIELARAFAAAGQSVLVIGADLYRPALAARLDIKASFRWEQVMAGQKSADDIIQRDPQSPIAVIAADRSPIPPVALFNAPAFANLIAKLRDRYDRIIIDNPPITASADPAMLGAVADITVLVVRYRQTTYTAVAEALRQMALYSLPVTGIVLNHSEVRPSYYYSPRPPAGRLERVIAFAQRLHQLKLASVFAPMRGGGNRATRATTDRAGSA
jgi:capsular exopolysaccharide synthesis family protein